jgi:DNA-directed RNA polymerase subunit RPC12/RpoP
MLEKQELYCHNCGNYVQFDIDIELNGNHVLNCPNCGHEHCRVVKDGVITDDRWDSRNNTYSVTQTSWTTVSTFNTYLSGTSNNNVVNNDSAKVFLYQAWMNNTSISSSGVLIYT